MADIFSYRVPSKEAFHHRKNFYLCQRKHSETNEKWLQRIRNCVSRCDFGGFSEFMMLDKFISGLNNEIFERFRPAQTLSTSEMMSIANSSDQTNRPNRESKPMLLIGNVNNLILFAYIESMLLKIVPSFLFQFVKNNSSRTHRNNEKIMRNISDTEEENTCSIKDCLDESTDWTNETKNKPQISDQTKPNQQPIKRNARELQTVTAIKGYEKNAKGEFKCLDCGKIYKTRCTYNLHKRM